MQVRRGPLSGVDGFDGDEPIQWASRAKRRTCFTHCAFICSEPRVQRKLPQLVLVNEKVNLADYNAIVAQSPENVYVKRQASAWNNEDLMVTLIGVLKEHLVTELEQYEVVLFLDCAKCHLARRVALACNRHNIRLIILPAKLTWLLQPCDTHLFSIYKNYMRVRWREIAALKENGEVDLLSLFTIIFDTIENVINARSWKHAFMENGFHTNFARLSDFIMKRLQYTEKPAINTTQPTLETFAFCYPARLAVPANLLLKPWQPPALPALPAAPASPAPAALPAPAPQAALPAPPQPRARPLGPGSANQRSLLARALASAPDPWQRSEAPVPPQEAQTARQEVLHGPTTSPASPSNLPWRLRSQTSRRSAKQ